MNFLAHIYLSNNDPYLQLGNFIADAVKGKKYLNFEENIQRGILLHRSIDVYTDQHRKVRAAKRFFNAYGHYRGVIVDIIFDHFLAANWHKYHEVPLPSFSQNFYEMVADHIPILPEKVQLFFPIMYRNNWLLKYATLSGISDILFQMNYRTNNISKMNFAIIELTESYKELEELFFDFFEDLEGFVFLKQIAIK